MVKELKSFFRKLEILIDVLIIFIGAIVTNAIFAYVYDPVNFVHYDIIPDFSQSSYYYLILTIFIFSIISFLYFDNVYVLQRYLTIRELVKKIFLSYIKSVLFIVFLLMLFGTIEFPVTFFIILAFISFIILIGYRVILYKLLKLLYSKNIINKNIIIVGEDIDNSELIKKIKSKEKVFKINIDKIFDIKNKENFDKFKRLLYDNDVDVVFFVPANDDFFIGDKFYKYIEETEILGIRYRIFMNYMPKLYKYQTQLSMFNNRSSIILELPQQFNERFLIKRVFDIVGGFLGVFATMLMYPILYILIKLDSKGPVLFSQKRVGINGRVFKIYKFRTMYTDAEERKKELMKQNEMRGAIFKMENDPRITKVGKILRKYSIDEFPQFFNVLKGDMSLVGTRPPTVDEVKEYAGWHHKRISIKPGLTGMWQVSGRNSIDDFDEIVKLDIEYIDNWSIILDIKIIIKTFRAIFEGK